MTVVPAKQIYKCFACGAGGDAFSFMMAYHRMSFPEALRALAERANIALPEHGSRSDGAAASDEPSPRQRILDANALAQRFFQHALADPHAGAVARAYIDRRGISREMLEAFAIGCAPDEWSALAEHVAKQRADRKAFIDAGLIVPRGGESVVDASEHVLPQGQGAGPVPAFGRRPTPARPLSAPRPTRSRWRAS